MVIYYPEAGTRGMLFECAGRGQHAAWENVALDKVCATPIFLESTIVNGDDLYDSFATWSEQLVQCFEISRPVSFSHCFEHFNRNDMVVLPLDITIIRKLEVGLMIPATSFGTLLSKGSSPR